MPSPVPSPSSSNTIPTGASAAGSILFTAIAAPSTPAAGKGSVYVDSTSKNVSVKNDAGAVSHGVRTKAAVVNQFLTAIADDGTVSAAQPAFTDISGSIPSATAAAGSLLFTAIAAPGTPASGKASVYVDSTSKNIAVKNDAGVVNHGVQTVSFVANQWLTSINADGSGNLQQPSFSNISGQAAYAQIQDISATSRVLGRKTAGSGVIEELTGADIASMTVLDTQSVTTQATLTTASWTANAWSKIEIELFGLAIAGVGANSDIRLRANNDSSAKYGSTANFHSSVNAPQSETIGTPTSAFVAELNTQTTKSIGGVITIFPKTATSRMRVGLSRFGTFPASATVAEYFGTEGSFVWSDTTTNWTFSTIIFGSSSTFTGTMIVRGYP